MNGQQLFAPAGKSASNAEAIIDYSIGDLVVGYSSNAQFQINEGFSKPPLKYRTMNKLKKIFSYK